MHAAQSCCRLSVNVDLLNLNVLPPALELLHQNVGNVGLHPTPPIGQTAANHCCCPNLQPDGQNSPRHGIKAESDQPSAISFTSPWPLIPAPYSFYPLPGERRRRKIGDYEHNICLKSAMNICAEALWTALCRQPRCLTETASEPD